MPLVKASLQSGIEAAMSDALSASEDLEGSTPQQVENAAPGIVSDLVAACGAALQSYLEAMIDPTGDGVIAIPRSACDSIFESLFQFRNLESSNMAAIAQPEVQQAWAGIFPLSFRTSIPPPGGVAEVTA